MCNYCLQYTATKATFIFSQNIVHRGEMVSKIIFFLNSPQQTRTGAFSARRGQRPKSAPRPDGRRPGPSPQWGSLSCPVIGQGEMVSRCSGSTQAWPITPLREHHPCRPASIATTRLWRWPRPAWPPGKPLPPPGLRRGPSSGCCPL
jgi:hypothetical protein